MERGTDNGVAIVLGVTVVTVTPSPRPLSDPFPKPLNEFQGYRHKTYIPEID